jgi:hypothetical protein
MSNHNPDDEGWRPRRRPPPRGGAAACDLQTAIRRQRIAGAQRVQQLLNDIDLLRVDLDMAACDLRALLGHPPLAEAFAQFQHQGGVTAGDWEDWLGGRELRGRQRPSGKRHLRIVADNGCEPTVVKRHGGDHAA